MKIEAEMEIEITGLTWIEEQWEFDHPSVILTPIKRYSPNGDSADQMIEDLCIDACVDGELKDEDCDKEFGWRGWRWEYLRRVYRQCVSGKEFPHKDYQAFSAKIRFYLDENGQLDSELINSN